MGAMEVGIAVRGREVLGLNSAAIGLMFFGCGLVMLLVQSLAFRPQRDAFGLWRLLLPAFVISAVGLAMLMAGAGALILAPIVTYFSPLARMREMPSPQEPVLTESVTEERAGD